MVIDGPREAVRLDIVIEQLRAGLERVGSGQALRDVRRAIQEYRQVQRAQRTDRQW